jgi:hypothetical protein
MEFINRSTPARLGNLLLSEETSPSPDMATAEAVAAASA